MDAADFSPELFERADQLVNQLKEFDAGLALLELHGQSAISRLFLISDFAATVVQRDIVASASWLAQPAEALCDPETIKRTFAAIDVDPIDAEMRQIRLIRHRILAGLLLADVCLSASLQQVLTGLSATADAAIARALAMSATSMLERHGRLVDANGTLVQLGVLAMGKLGGGELNFSSDIDLVFVHRVVGDSDGPKPLAAETYFTRQARRFIRYLDEVTADGFVFRVDARLRPFGDSGPLVVTVDALESYLAVHGREWERYAYLKARAISSDQDLIDELSPLLRSFVYRSYLDFGVLESLREMKSKIREQVARKSMADNIKLGPGGIREIEFIVQSLQLIRGGAEPSLRERSLLRALQSLADIGALTPTTAQSLKDAYVFLRKLENTLQGLKDQQTHCVPVDDESRQRLAFALRFSSVEQLLEKLDQCRQTVSGVFESAIERDSEPSDRISAWSGQPATVAKVLDIEISDPLCNSIVAFHREIDSRPLQAITRERLQKLMPLLLSIVVKQADPNACWQRLQPIIESVLRRSAYLSLLIENPPALERFVALAGHHDYLSGELARNPALLDELLDLRISADLDVESLDAELASVLGRVDRDDTDAVMQALTAFQRVASFRTAVADVSGVLPVMKVADRLTSIAELIVKQALNIAWRALVARHGLPGGASHGGPALGVIAYGKLGGLELAYGSDLDLVFLHGLDLGAATDGPNSIANEVFFARLVRKLTHLLTFQTRLGPMYEVDIRLRPSGRRGMLVSTLDAFERYQRNEAWTWEHQALVRARPIAGDHYVADRFVDIRAATLSDHVRRETVAAKVEEMREKMRKELDRGLTFDIKQSRGGLVDIEFLVQYWILVNAHEHPSLLEFSDNVRQLNTLATLGVIEKSVAEALTTAYLKLRAAANQRALTGAGDVSNHPSLQAHIESVRSLWSKVLVSSRGG